MGEIKENEKLGVQREGEHGVPEMSEHGIPKMGKQGVPNMRTGEAKLGESRGLMSN